MSFAVAGTVLTVGSTIYSANKAAGAQKDAANLSNDTQRYFYDTTRQDNQPMLDARNWALEQLKAQLTKGFTPTNVQNEAGYQFGMNQGMQALQNQLAARGMRNSGAALKAGTRYAQDYAGTKFNDAFNRNLASLTPLQSMAGLGQSAAGLVGSAAMNAGNNISQTQASLGNALGANYLGTANSIGNSLNQGMGWYAKQTQLPGFNGNALSGYTYQNPWDVGPPQ